MRKFWLTFAGIQVFAVLACQGGKFTSSFALASWVTGLVLLFPGVLLGEAIHQRYFWMGPFGKWEADLLELFLCLLINGLVWFGFYKAFRRIKDALQQRKTNA